VKKLITLIAVFAFMAVGCTDNKGQKEAPVKKAPAVEKVQEAAPAQASTSDALSMASLISAIESDAKTAGIDATFEQVEIHGLTAAKYSIPGADGVMVLDGGQTIAELTRENGKTKVKIKDFGTFEVTSLAADASLDVLVSTLTGIMGEVDSNKEAALKKFRPQFWAQTDCGDGWNAYWIPDGRAKGACQKHDRCYSQCRPRADCDWDFLIDMKNAGVNFAQRRTYYHAVRAFGNGGYCTGDSNCANRGRCSECDGIEGCRRRRRRRRW